MPDRTTSRGKSIVCLMPLELSHAFSFEAKYCYLTSVDALHDSHIN